MPPRTDDLGNPSDRRVKITVIAAEPDAIDTLRIMSNQIGLITDSLPSKPPFQIEIDAPQGSRGRVVAMLSALGVKVQQDDQRTGQALTVGIVPEIWAKRDGLAAPLAALVGQSCDSVAAGLAQPGGLILPAMPPEAAERLRRAIRRIRGVTVSLSDPAAAVYDLFTVAPPSPDLMHHLRLIGHPVDPLTGALAAGLDDGLVRHLRQRFASAGLLFIDRAFQRFDILLTGTGRWVSAELADFLIGRTALPRARFETISPENPIRIEACLTRTAAIQFHADYAAIGLDTQLALTGLENT